MLLVITGILKVLEPEITAKIAAYIIIGVITFFVWSLSNRLPKPKKGQVGFAISISTGDESERKRSWKNLL